MPYKFSWKFFAISRGFVGLSLVLMVGCEFFAASAASGQPLDWAGDITVFGSSADEERPVAVVSPSGASSRVFCIRDDSCLCVKMTTDGGQSWSVLSDTVFAGDHLHAAGISDHEYHYVVVRSEASSLKALFRFAPASDSFSDATFRLLSPERTRTLLDIAVSSNAANISADPVLDIGWIEEVSDNTRTLCFTQSRNRGEDFRPVSEISTFTSSPDTEADVAVCSGWHLENEIRLVAASVDRPGSIPEAINVFRSTDDGNTWTTGMIIDPASIAQRQPSIGACGTTVVLAYSAASHQGYRDVRCVFSFDGGLSFSEPLAVAATNQDESTPEVSVDPNGIAFRLFYLSGVPWSDSATVLTCGGTLSDPWNLGAAIPVSESNSMCPDGGFSVGTCATGVAAVWTASFISGDHDIRFDASWRGSSVPRECRILPLGMELGSLYPNPFNARAWVNLTVSHSASTTLMISDILGRIVDQRVLMDIRPGTHRIALDFSNLPAGVYWVLSTHDPGSVQRAVLVK